MSVQLEGPRQELFNFFCIFFFCNFINFVFVLHGPYFIGRGEIHFVDFTSRKGIIYCYWLEDTLGAPIFFLIKLYVEQKEIGENKINFKLIINYYTKTVYHLFMA